MPWTIGDLLFIALVGALIFGIMAMVNRSRRARPANMPALPDRDAGDLLLRSVLEKGRVVALVGASADPARPSHQVMEYLLSAGYTVYPVTPKTENVLGRKTYANLLDIPEKPDIIDVFRDPTHVPEIAREAVAAAAKVLWLQEGVNSPEGMQIARQGGLTVVMDHCIMKEHRRLFSRN